MTTRKRAELFNYLVWLEAKHRSEELGLHGKPYLCLSSSGKTCWGDTYEQAVEAAWREDEGDKFIHDWLWDVKRIDSGENYGDIYEK